MQERTLRGSHRENLHLISNMLGMVRGEDIPVSRHIVAISSRILEWTSSPSARFQSSRRQQRETKSKENEVFMKYLRHVKVISAYPSARTTMR
jgi:hypothetical protein